MAVGSGLNLYVVLCVGYIHGTELFPLKDLLARMSRLLVLPNFDSDLFVIVWLIATIWKALVVIVTILENLATTGFSITGIFGCELYW